MSDREEIVTEFDGLRVRSAFEVVEIEPGCVAFRIEGPVIEFDDDEFDLAQSSDQE